MFVRKVAIAVLAASCVWAVSADTIIFKSGSRLEGTIVRIIGNEITFKSDDVGEIKVAADKVASLTTTNASTVQYNDKSTEEGVVNMKDGAYTVSGKSLDMGNVKAVNPEQEAWHGSVNFSGFAAILLAAFLGAMVVMAIIFFFSTVVRNSIMLLIIGIMVGYISNSAISLLNFFATDEGVKSYMVWGLGSFGGVSMANMPVFASVTLIGILGALVLIKPLNALMLGEQYAENLGVNIIRVRNWLLIVTGLLTAITTAFCGPVAFIGLAVPHIVRLLITTDNHRQLLPATLLCGAVVALICNLICYLPGEHGVIPLNAVTPLIGAPVIIYVIARKKS